MKKVIQTTKAPEPVGPYSQALCVGQFLYCSGQIPLVPETGEVLSSSSIEVQTKQVMKNIGAVLEEAGFSFSDVIKNTIFLTDLGDFQKVNGIYSTYFTPPFPARSCVQVSALPKGVSVEIEVIACSSDYKKESLHTDRV